MNTIYKYKLEVQTEQVVVLPVGATVLSAQAQGGDICLWALVDPEEKNMMLRTVWVHGTGHPVTDAATKGRFLGTVQLSGGALIFHVFIFNAEGKC